MSRREKVTRTCAAAASLFSLPLYALGVVVNEVANLVPVRRP